MTHPVGEDLTRAVLARLDGCADERFRQVMQALVRQLHAFAREVSLTPDEWRAAIDFLTAAGQACTPQRQELVLLSDTLGLSMLVVALAQAQAAGHGEGAIDATDPTVEGPYYIDGAPECPCGTDIAEGVRGEATFYAGRVTDTEGNPLSGALLDVWSGDGEGCYDMQSGAPMRARGRFRTDDQGRYWFWSIRPAPYPVPADGPVGDMLVRMGRHPYRPGHIHMKVSAPGHRAVTTHLFVAGGDYLDSDAVFGVRESLVVDFDRHGPGEAADGRRMRKPYWSAHYDFRLAPDTDVAPQARLPRNP